MAFHERIKGLSAVGYDICIYIFPLIRLDQVMSNQKYIMQIFLAKEGKNKQLFLETNHLPPEIWNSVTLVTKLLASSS